MKQLKFNEQGLIPVIAQDADSGEVLMLAYMNDEALQKTQQTRQAWYYSRSRQKLWHKGETSGHVQEVRDMYYDCDADTLLLKVKQTGAACHEGYRSCFHYKLDDQSVEGNKEFDPEQVYQQNPLYRVIREVYDTILERKQHPQEGSYTCYLFDKGQDKILKKVGEEAAETIIGSKNNSNDEVIYEMSDLWYHCLVLLAYHGITPEQICKELLGRRK